jgi:nucleoside 2-deoxyribosyltransferase
MQNPDIKYIHSDGIDLPIMRVYLGGRISGNCIDKCLSWRHQIINHYKDYNGKGVYPISFLDPLNSKESDSIDKLGLTSAIPPNMIYDKDLLSVKTADVIVANMDDFFEEDLHEYQWTTSDDISSLGAKNIKLRKKIENRRENIGTIMEVAWALYLQKPVILIVPSRRKEIYEKHPFSKRASVIVESVEQLLNEKWLNILYKSISSATY